MKKIIKMSIGFASILSITGLVIACSDSKENEDNDTIKINELKSAIKKNLNIIVPKDGVYDSTSKIFDAVKKVIEKRSGIDTTHTKPKYLKLKENQTITSVATHGQTATNLIIIIDNEEITLKLNQAQYTSVESTKINSLKSHLTGINLNITLPKGASTLYDTDAKILAAIKVVLETRANIDSSHTTFINKKSSESNVTSVAAYSQTPTNYKITIDGTDFTLKLNQDQHTSFEKLYIIKSHLTGANLNIILPKGALTLYDTDAKILAAIKLVLESRTGIDSSHTTFISKKSGENNITSVAAHGQTATDYKITVDGTDYTLKLNQAQYTSVESSKINTLKTHLAGANLNIILPKGASTLYDTDAKILAAIKVVLKSRTGIDSSHTAFISKKIGESNITSVAAHGQTATDYKITVDGTDYTLKLNQAQYTKANDYVTKLDLDSKIYGNSTAKILNLSSDSNTNRTIYIENENLYIKLSLVNPHFRNIRDKTSLKKIIAGDVKEIAQKKAKLGDAFDNSLLKNDLNDNEENEIKTLFNKNDAQLNALLSNMKFGVAHAFYVGNKYDENSDDYEAWESSNVNDYIYSNLLAQVSKTSTAEQVKAENDKILAEVDLPNYTGTPISPNSDYSHPKVKKLVLDTSKTNFFDKTIEWYKKYFPLKSK